MGKRANEQAYREFERIQNRKQDASFEDEPPLSEAQRAAQFDDVYWDRLDSEVRFFGGAR